MKILIAFLFLAACLPAAEPVTLYARVQEPLVVKVSDGTVVEIEKGDCFPVIAYKESHTKLIVRIARNTFIVPGKSAVIVPDKEKDGAIESYRACVNKYLNSYSSDWRKHAEAGAPK